MCFERIFCSNYHKRMCEFVFKYVLSVCDCGRLFNYISHYVSLYLFGEILSVCPCIFSLLCLLAPICGFFCLLRDPCPKCDRDALAAKTMRPPDEWWTTTKSSSTQSSQDGEYKRIKCLFYISPLKIISKLNGRKYSARSDANIFPIAPHCFLHTPATTFQNCVRRK